MYYEYTRDDGFTITTDPKKMSIDEIHSILLKAYWCEGIPKEVVERSVRNSICYGVFYSGKQIGIARVITDYATFAYLADVFIEEEYRGKKLGVWLVECIMNNPELQNLRRWMLITKDAHELYRRYGFKETKYPERIMDIHRPDIYKNSSLVSERKK